MKKQLGGLLPHLFKTKLLLVLIGVASIGISSSASAIHYRYDRGRGPQANNSAIIPYNGGPVLATSKTFAIFWGRRWNNPNYAQDEITGVDQLLGGMNGSTYLSIANEYFFGATGTDGYQGHVIEPSRAPKDEEVNNDSHSVVEEVCRVTGHHPDPSTVYFVITDRKLHNSGGYCAFHDVGHCSNGATVFYAYMPGKYPGGECSPGDVSGLHSLDMTTIADNAAHEFMEAITDPAGNAWENPSDEIGDACDYTYTNTNPLGLMTLANGTQWRIQTEWSNRAYENGTGQVSDAPGDPHEGLPGCVSGPPAGGKCMIQIYGSCNNYPSLSNAGFEDTWGEEYANACSSATECAQRASDYHAWCGYSPVVQSTFTLTGAVTTVDCNINIQGVCQNNQALNYYNGPDWWGMVSVYSAVSAPECAQRAYDYMYYCGSSAPVVSWYGITGAVTTANPTPQPPICAIGLTRGSVDRGQHQIATLYCGGGPASSGYAILSTHGNVIIWGCNQSYEWDPWDLGAATVTGYVSGPGGSNSCAASYWVSR